MSSSTSAAASPSAAEVITSKQDGVGSILLNRPRALNALTLGMVRALDAVFHTWDHDPDVSVVVMMEEEDDDDDDVQYRSG